MKEQKHEVIVKGELNTTTIEKEHIDAMCRSLLKDLLGYYQKTKHNQAKLIDVLNTDTF